MVNCIQTNEKEIFTMKQLLFITCTIAILLSQIYPLAKENTNQTEVNTTRSAFIEETSDEILLIGNTPGSGNVK